MQLKDRVLRMPIATSWCDNHPNAENVLEIACGTGAVLRELATQYEVTGLDISRAMLRIAHKKLPKTQFYQQDMTSFRIGRTFDAVICPYDAINHLLADKKH